MKTKGLIMLANMANTLIRPLAPLLHRLGWLTRDEADVQAKALAAAEAERTLEEEKWKIEAALEMERREIEWEKQAIAHDRLLLETYALSIGVPVVKRKEAMH